MQLKTYWFIVFPENRFGPRNFGVTAYSKEEGKKLITEEVNHRNMQELIANFNDTTEVIEDIDIRLLDQGHVIPNMGVVTFKGVWYPHFNMH